MLEHAAERFASNSAVQLEVYDLSRPLTELPAGAGPFDVVVSGLAIHHLQHERKRALFGEIHALLAPGGVFANLDLVTSASPRLHERFRCAIGRVQEDPEDNLAGLCEQLGWLRDAGFEDVDCHFKWLELVLLVAVRGARG
jgi:cyclopropane fatty-acyl-phospholipid synthase-like methyltransferase